MRQVGAGDKLDEWEFVSVMYSSNKTIGLWDEQLSNMFECPDFFPIGSTGKWMFITSEIFQGPCICMEANRSRAIPSHTSSTTVAQHSTVAPQQRRAQQYSAPCCTAVPSNSCCCSCTRFCFPFFLPGLPSLSR